VQETTLKRGLTKVSWRIDSDWKQEEFTSARGRSARLAAQIVTALLDTTTLTLACGGAAPRPIAKSTGGIVIRFEVLEVLPVWISSFAIYAPVAPAELMLSRANFRIFLTLSPKSGSNSSIAVEPLEQ
jgi:hypothetical protein